MKLSEENVKELIFNLGFLPEDGLDGIYYKNYNNFDYIIKIDFNNKKIEYRNSNIDETEGIRWGDSTTSNFENSENFVVLECVNRLIEKGYSPNNIILEYKFPLGRNEKGKLDILVFSKDRKSYLMIECKTWGSEFYKEQKKMQKNGGQLFSYYVQDKATKYLCLYTSHLSNNNVEYKNDIIKVDEAWTELNNQKEIHDHWNKNVKDNGIFEEWSYAYDVEIMALVRSRLKPLTKDDSGRIFNQFAEILRHNVVSDKPNAFNKILNLFICKIIDEDKNDTEQLEFQWLDDDNNESLQLRLNDLYKKGMHRFLDIDVTDFTENDITDTLVNVEDSRAQKNIREMIIKLRLQKNPEFAFIEVYDDNSFNLNARVVREVVELMQPFQFRYGHKQQFLGDFFELLLNTSIKQEAGQYFTPVPITRYIISSFPIKEFIQEKLKTDDPNILPTVIDFACGTGHFLTEYMDKVQTIIENEIDSKNAKPTARKKFNYWCGEDGKFEWASEFVYGIDADYRLVKSSKVSSFLNGDGEANIIRANGLDHFSKSKEYKGKLKLHANDNSKDNGQFELLIANPPYSVSSFKSTVKYGDESFELFNKFTDNSSEIECLFVERMKQLLKIGGYAGIILPSSILSNTGIYTATREILLKYFKIVAITEFGSNTFMATGTNTVTLFLERRSNNDHKYIQNAVNNFFEKPKDVTVLSIEKAFSKYVTNVFGEITFDDYISFINRNPNKTFSELEIYKDYQVWFNNLTEVKILKAKKAFKELSSKEQQNEFDKLFFEKVFAIEKDKMLYFLLTYPQKTVITKVGEKQEEKDFIGYEFSNRRGHEGIKMLPSGTRLYDESDQQNEEKANSYIYNAFIGEYPTIDESLVNNISVVNTYCLIDFGNVQFYKLININAINKITLESKYEAWPLEKLAEFQNGLWKGEKGELEKVKVLRNTNFKLNNGRLSYDDIAEIDVELSQLISRKLRYGDIILEKSGGSSSQAIGRVALFDKDNANEIYSFSNFCSRIRVVNDNVNNIFLWLMLNVFYNKGGTIPLQNGVRLLNIDLINYKKVKIPLPPINIQEKIVSEIRAVEAIETANIEKVGTLQNDIDRQLANPSKLISYKIEDIAQELFAGGDLPTNRYSKTKTSTYNIPILANAATNEGLYGYTDIVKVNTPCVTISARGTIGYTKARFSPFYPIVRLLVLVPKKEMADVKYLEYAISKMAVYQFGKNIPQLTVPQISSMRIDLPLLDEQKSIVSRIEAIENEIQALKTKIATVEAEKKDILEKYL